jgi:tetratricopeptide (TPR) repeat protein
MLDRLEAAERDRPSVMACRLALMGQTGDWGAVVEQVNAVLPAAIRDDRPQAEWEQALADWDREVRLARVTGATNESGMVPRDLLMLTWRVRAQRELKKPAEAMASLKMLATALEREPAFALAVVQMFREWRMPDAACDAVQHAATFDSPLRYSVLEAAQMDAMEAGREDVAREHLETMARLNPSDHVVSARLALLLLDAGEPAERACALATAAHVAAPRDAVITDICALALARAGRAAEAFKLLEQIPPNLSEQPLFRFTRARVLAAADRAGEARALAVTIPETAVPARSRAELERLKAGGTAAP